MKQGGLNKSIAIDHNTITRITIDNTASLLKLYRYTRYTLIFIVLVATHFDSFKC